MCTLLFLEEPLQTRGASWIDRISVGTVMIYGDEYTFDENGKLLK